MAEESLTPRQIGDLYWKKRKKMLASAETMVRKGQATGGVRGALKEDMLVASRAESILEQYKAGQEDPSKDFPILSGNEFRVHPPTTCGDEALEHAVLFAMRARDRYAGLIKGYAEENISEIAKVWIQDLKQIIKLVNDMLRIWFEASGVELETGKAVPAEVKKQARAILYETAKAYEEKIRSFNRHASLKAAMKLGWIDEKDTLEALGRRLLSAIEEAEKDIRKAGEKSPRGRLLRETLEQFIAAVREQEEFIFIRERWKAKESRGGSDMADRDITFSDSFLWETEELSTEEKRREAERELMDIREFYREQFEGQTVSSIVSNPEVYLYTAHRARQLRDSIVNDQNLEETEEIKKQLLLSDTMYRVCCLANEFISRQKNAAADGSEEELAVRLLDMNYFVQERVARKAAKVFFASRSEED